MLHLKITSSNNPDIIGEHIYYLSEIYLGKSKGHILIFDPKLFDYHFRLETFSDGIICDCHPDVEYYLINGKRSEGKNKISPKETIQIGETIFFVEKFEHLPYESRKDKLNKNITDILESDPSTKNVLKLIENELNSV